MCLPRRGAEPAERLDRLSHVFTGDQDRDYRNMGLLWDAVGLLATSRTPAELARSVTLQLRRALAASLVALFESGASGLEFRHGVSRAYGQEIETEVDITALLPAQRDAVDRSAATREPVWVAADEEGAPQLVTCAVPLVIDDALPGVLLLAGASGYVSFDRFDLPFMKGFGGPIGLALQRARHAERRRQDAETEKLRLVGELKDLRTAVRQARLIHASRQMEQVIRLAHRVADTDATVLITGESGTGKEMLAQTIHQMSSRRSRPLVVVDCGAIPSTLIESELFGHERGAFTGALTRSPGRLVQADGGSVLLDEIGELPLEVQSKLLRFVQEKQLTAVGSSMVRRVDARVLAATNRDLPQEIAGGRFRADLFHRLNVIALAIPPLRERPDDILELARHFLGVFAPKYQKAVRHLGADVETALIRYTWPGNIRELQNRIMRAVIMSTGDTLTLDALSLPKSTSAAAGPAPAVAVLVGNGDRGDRRSTVSALAPGADPEDAAVAWAELRTCLAAVLSGVVRGRGAPHPPLGRWLDHDLVIAAFATIRESRSPRRCKARTAGDDLREASAARAARGRDRAPAGGMGRGHASRRARHRLEDHAGAGCTGHRRSLRARSDRSRAAGAHERGRGAARHVAADLPAPARIHPTGLVTLAGR